MKYRIEGQVVTADPRTQLVSHMEDWTRCDELVTAGYLRRVGRGPATYGHQDYYVKPQGRSAAERGC